MKKIMLLVCILLMTALTAYAAETTYSGVCDPIVIDQPGEHTVILNGVTIETTDTPAIEVKAPATKLTIILKNGTTNTVKSNMTDIANNGKELVIRCESAGKGHECSSACGKLVAVATYSGSGSGTYIEHFYYDSYIGSASGDMTGSITIAGGVIDAGVIGSGDKFSMSGNITISGGIVETVYIGCGSEAEMDGSVTISGGNITLRRRDAGAAIGSGVYSQMSGKITISGGNIDMCKRSFDVDIDEFFAEAEERIMTRGAINRTGPAIGSGWHAPLSGTITITGGHIEAVSGLESAAIGSGWRGEVTEDAVIEISGGVVSASGAMMGSGIGSGEDADMNGTIVISGGTVSAANMIGMGIGSPCNVNGTITVSGGTVKTYGIGANVLNGTVTISGGDVFSLNGIKSDRLNGKIIISGGKVKAFGDYDVGIGGIDMDGTVLISGGTVEAVGGSDFGFPGIGGVRMNGSIIISGGDVTAKGGTATWRDVDGAPGIGAQSDMKGSITFSGGSVKATGGSDGGPAIGSVQGELGGKIVARGGRVEFEGTGGFAAIGTGPQGSIAEDFELYVDPDAFPIIGKMGENQEGAEDMSDAPYVTKTDLRDLLMGKAYVQFDVDMPVAPPETDLPQTGDGMNFAFLAALTVVGVIGMTVILHRRKEA